MSREQTSTDSVTAATLARYASARSLPDGRILLTTVGGACFALSFDDWRDAMRDIEYLAGDTGTEIIYRTAWDTLK